MLFFNRENRFLISLFLSFLVGFVLFMISKNYLESFAILKEIKIILNRFSLSFILVGLVLTFLFFHKKVTWYNAWPNWKNPIVLSFHTIHVFWFWIIGMVMNGIVYMVIIVQRDVENLPSLFWFCLLFSLINAIMEEVIWRGILLSALKKHTSTCYAIFVTSVGFGLLHLAIGFSFFLSLLISLAGVIYAILTLKTNSIYPSIIFHFVINIGMVLSGLII